MNDVILSIVIPVYNGFPYIQETIKSALISCSDLENFEIVISNNFSTDATEEVIRNFNHPKIRVINPPYKMSIGENWSFVSLAAQGEYIKFLGADDVLYGLISNEIDLLSSHPNCVALISRRKVITGSGKVRIKSRGISRRLQVAHGNKMISKTWVSGTNLIGDPTALLFRKTHFQNSLPWEDKPFPYLVDLTLYLKCFSDCFVLLSPNVVSGFRIHKASITGKTLSGQARQFYGLFKIHQNKRNNHKSSPLNIVMKSARVWCMANVKQFAKVIFIRLFV
jgi:glycosyltransferase involved in cell wall biosynthesis